MLKLLRKIFEYIGQALIDFGEALAIKPRTRTRRRFYRSQAKILKSDWEATASDFEKVEQDLKNTMEKFTKELDNKK